MGGAMRPDFFWILLAWKTLNSFCAKGPGRQKKMHFDVCKHKGVRKITHQHLSPVSNLLHSHPCLRCASGGIAYSTKKDCTSTSFNKWFAIANESFACVAQQLEASCID
jgi:hypothetical protein